MSATQKHTEEGYRGPYLERGGESTAVLVDVLMQPPEHPLSDEEKEQAYAFEAQLADLNIAQDVTITEIIRKHKGEDVVAPLVFADAFLEGAIDNPELPHFTSADEVYAWFAERAMDKTLESSALLGLAKQSTEHYKKQMVNALLRGDELDESKAGYMQIVLDPVNAIETARLTMLAREHLLHLRRDNHRGGEGLSGAKRALIDVYLARVNSLIAADVPLMAGIQAQAELTDDEDTFEAAGIVMPATLGRAVGNSDTREQLLQRLDYIRNGMGLDEEMKASAVSVDLKGSERGVGEGAVFTPEQTEILKKNKLSPEVMRTIFTNVVRKAGLLSSEDPSTWSTTRIGWAADELFQVVENPTGGSFSVESETGVVRVSSKERSIYDVLVVGGFHELTHINQALADKELGKKLKIARLRGKRVSVLREGGANLEQRQAETKFFGRSKPIALTYAKAFETLATDGSIVDATRVFFDEKTRVLPDDDRAEAASNSVDGALRLLRFGGVNSQPLSYAEEGILIQELEGSSKEASDRATAITGLDLVDQVRLHRYGLLPEVSHDSIDWTEYVLEELMPYIEEALSETSDK